MQHLANASPHGRQPLVDAAADLHPHALSPDPPVAGQLPYALSPDFPVAGRLLYTLSPEFPVAGQLAYALFSDFPPSALLSFAMISDGKISCSATPLTCEHHHHICIQYLWRYIYHKMAEPHHT
jgi:hypothetical protein